MVFTQAKSDAGMATGLMAVKPEAYQQGNINSNEVIIMEFVTGTGVGIEENTIDQSVNIFPNPTTTDILKVSSESTISNIQIMNVSGQLIKNIDCNKTQVSINTSGLDNGIYFARIHTANKFIIKKVQILR